MTKLTATLDYWDCLRKTKEYPKVFDKEGKYVSGGGYYEDQSSEITRQETIEGETEIDLFEKFYKLNNSLRYCNGTYYKWQNVEWQNKYSLWLNSDDYKAKSFNLYYGNGVVD